MSAPDKYRLCEIFTEGKKLGKSLKFIDSCQLYKYKIYCFLRFNTYCGQRNENEVKLIYNFNHVCQEIFLTTCPKKRMYKFSFSKQGNC